MYHDVSDSGRPSSERVSRSGIALAALVLAASSLLAQGGICSDDPTNGCMFDLDCNAGFCQLPAGGGDLIPPGDNVYGCMNDVYNLFGQGGDLNCTANDVGVTAIHDLEIVDPCEFPGDTATINFVAEFDLTSNRGRHDVGVYIAADGGDALSGICSISSFPYAADPPWADIDGTADDTKDVPGDPFGYCSPDGGTTLSTPALPCTTDSQCGGGTCEEFGPGLQDLCGDIDSTHDPLFHQIQGVAIQCVDEDADGFVESNACFSWREPGVNDLCLTPYAAFPGSPAKCNCQALPDIVVPVPGQITVDKVTLDADGDPLPGDATLFDFTLTGPDTELPASFQLADADPPYQSPGLDAPNTYVLTETVPNGWALVSAICTSDQGAPQDLIASGGQVTVDLGESLHCTFTNRLDPQPALGLDKSFQSNADEDGSGTVSVGDTLTYEFVATNEGNIELTDVTITDPLPGLSALTCDPTQPSNLLPGESMTCTATYVVTQADVDAGRIDNTATADSNETDPVTDPETVPVPRTPDIDLVKNGTFNDESGDGFAQAGETISYTFDVTNTGNVTLSNVAVTDPMVSPIPCPSGNPIPSLAPGATETCTGTYTVTQADVDAGQKDNTATATGEDPAGDPVTDNDDHSEPLPSPAATIDLVKDGIFNDESGDGFAQAGETISYTFDVTNTSSVTLTNVSVTDPMVSPIPCPSGNPIPSLAPGATETCTGTYTVTQADVDAGQKDNTATATGEDPAGDPVTDNDDHSEPLPSPAATIDLVKDGIFNDESGDGFAQAGETISYTFDVTNTSSVTLTNVSVTDPMVSPIPCPSGNPIPSLAPGATETCTGTYTVTQSDVDAGQKDNTATATGEDPAGDPVTDNDDHSEPLPSPAATIDLVKDGIFNDESGDGFAQAGETISYTFDVTNTSSVTLTNVSVTDPMVSPITCPSGNPIPSMAPGATEQCTGTYTVTQADVDAGQKDNTATATGEDPAGDPVTDSDDHSEPLPSPAATIDLVKDGTFNDESGDGFAQAGETISYTFNVTNTSGVTLTNVSVTDLMVSPITCPSGNPIPSMAPGATEQCTGTYTVTQSDVDAGQKDNTATATGEDPAGDPVTDSDDHSEPLPSPATIDLVKDGTFNDESGDGFAQAGETISYTFNVTNTSGVTLTNVSVTDPMVSPITCPSGNPIPSMAPGATEQCTGTYTVTQPDVDAGQKDNTATATGEDPAGDPVTDSDDHSEPLRQNRAIDLVKDGTFNDESGDGFAQAGETISYTFDVTNTGNVTLTSVAVTDPMVSPITCPSGNPIPSMAPGATEQCTGSYTVTQADIDAGRKDNTATAQGFAPGDRPVSDTDTHSEPLLTPISLPAIDLVKDGALDLGVDGTANPGDLINYSFLVTNTGNVELTSVTVSDPMVSPITCPGGNGALSLAVGASVTCTGSYAITQADIDAAQKLNTATATGLDPGGDPVNDQDDHLEPIPQSPGLTLDKDGVLVIATPIAIDLVKNGNLDLGADGESTIGDLISYSFVVTNTGAADLFSVNVSDPLVPSITCPAGNPIPSLVVGASQTCTGSYAITQADIDAGVVDNTATAIGQDALGNTASDIDSHSEPVPPPGLFPCPGAFIVQSVNAEISQVLMGDPITLVPITGPTGIEINNLGYRSTDGLMYGVELSSSGNVQIVQVDVFGNVTGLGRPTGLPANVRFDAGDVSPDGTTMYISYHGTSLYTLDLSSAPTLPAVVNVGVSGPTGFVFDWSVRPADGLLYGGDSTGGQLAILDPGTGVRTDVNIPGLPAGSAFGGAWFDGTGSLFLYRNNGELYEIDVDAGVILSVTSGPPSGRNDAGYCATGPTRAAETSGALRAGILDGPLAKLQSQPGDLINYTFTVTNIGNIDLTNVAVNDPIVPVITCPSGNPIPVLAIGASETCTGSYSLTQADVDAGVRENTATADSDQTPPVTDTHIVPLPQEGAIDLVKTGSLDDGGDGVGDVGDLIDYSFAVTNTGQALLSQLVVSDPLVASIDCGGVTTLAVGASVICTGSYALVQADLDAGVVNNTATATALDPALNPVSDVDSHSEPIPLLDICGDAYLIQDLDAQLTQVDQSVSPFVFNLIGAPAGFEINNIGYNELDDMLYGVRLTSGGNVGLVQIEPATGVVTGLGVPSGLPPNIRFDAGDVSPTGTMYINRSGFSPLYTVELGTQTVTTIPYTGSTGIVFDWAFNPDDGLLYGGDSTSGQLAILDPGSGTRTDVGVAGLPSGTAFGGAWFNDAGRLFLYQNNGTIYEIDLAGPSIVGTQSGPGATRNDGAACIANP